MTLMNFPKLLTAVLWITLGYTWLVFNFLSATSTHAEWLRLNVTGLLYTSGKKKSFSQEEFQTALGLI